MKFLGYKVTIKLDDNNFQIKYVKSRTELAKLLNVSKNTLDNIIANRIKNKYNFITIERIHLEEPNSVDIESKKEAQRQANKRFNEKKKNKTQHELKLKILSSFTAK